ncbi:MAG TPA: alpha/beta hydrolase, partial [Caulobacteraceae bacterium]|nr:alpha/beta hydrolase [Caulobacteraceae bacterium]
AAPFSGPALSAVGSVSIDPPLLRALQQVMFAPQEPPPGWLERFPYDQVLSPAAMVREGEDAATVLPGSPLGHVDLHRITAPITILAGDEDKVVDPDRHAAPLARRRRRAELVRLPGVGHMVHHAAPEAVIAAVEAQLAPA